LALSDEEMEIGGVGELKRIPTWILSSPTPPISISSSAGLQAVV
jgi:hypothetical protein